MAAAITINLNATVTTTEKCPHCENGHTGRMISYCRDCGRDYRGFDWNTWDNPAVPVSLKDTMPCGCSFACLIERDEECPDCEGSCIIVRQIPLLELFEAFSQMYSQVYGR